MNSATPLAPTMDYAALESLRRTHPAWRLLVADHAPLLISFLHMAFIKPNVRSLPEQELVSRLDDHLFHLRERLGAKAFPRASLQYLESWASDEHGWLRRYYAADRDEPWFDLTPSVERAIGWVISLEQRQFIGTESRLRTVFDLLHQMVDGTETNPTLRITELEKKRASIDEEIRKLRAGHVDVMDDARVKDRFQQFAETARDLLADFREVDANFRTLDRDVREKITTWEGGKGQLLENIFGARDQISDSDQGRSFRAFWDLLMSPSRQEQLTSYLVRVFELPAVQQFAPDRRLLRIHYDWLEAGEVTQRTVARLSEQLRRYLDDRAWLENRRIMGILREIEQHAISLRNTPPDGTFMELDADAPGLNLPFERPLFTPPHKTRVDEHVVSIGEDALSSDKLFEQFHIDKTRLLDNVRRALQTRAQVSLAELLDETPLEQGLAELVAYLTMATEDQHALISDAEPQTITWKDAVLGQRAAQIPRVIFTRARRT